MCAAECGDDDHHQLIAVVQTLRGSCVISGYQCELYSPLEDASCSVLRITPSTIVVVRGLSHFGYPRVLRGRLVDVGTNRCVEFFCAPKADSAKRNQKDESQHD